MLRVTLRNKINFFVISLIIFFGGLACFFVFIFAKNSLVENKKKDTLSIIIQQSAQINEIFFATKNLSETIANQDLVTNYLDNKDKVVQDAKVLTLLQQYTIRKMYLAIYLLDNKGTCIVSTDPRFVDQNYSFRNYFKVSKTGQSIVEANIGVTSKELGYYFAQPIKTSDGQFLGTSVVKLNPDIINTAIKPSSLMSGNVMLVSGDGVVIFSNDLERQFKSVGILNKETKQRIEESQKFTGLDIRPMNYDYIQQEIEEQKDSGVIDFFDNLDKKEEIVSFAKIGDTNFYLVGEENKDIFVAQAINISLIIIIFIFFGVVGCGLATYFLIAKAFRPFNQLKKVAQLIAAGNLSQKVEIKSGDELEDLGSAVNSMIDSLRESYANLEGKVNEKTKEIAASLKDISEKNRILGDTQKAVVSVLEDIQDEKNISQDLANNLVKFQLAVEYSSDHVIITNIDGKIIYANKAAEKITGYTKEQMLGKTPALWGKQMPKEFYEKMWHTIKEEKKEFSGEINNKRANGVSYFAEAHIIPILGKDKKIEFFVGIERDITKAKEVDRAKTEFVSLASHQLRTPLTAISWYLEMLMNGKAGKVKPEQLKYLSEVYHAGLRMRDLVNALLNVSRIDMGTFAIEPEQINLVEVAESVIKEMDPVIISKKIKITKKYKELPEKYIADIKLFRIILQNLLSNAFKYTPPKGKVDLVVEKRDRDILITVSDNGCGIPTGQQDRIFTKLFRADNAKIKDPDGTGLGLYIIKSILDNCGGKIWFQSEENKGSTFFVSLPLIGMSKKEGTKALI